jgi:hypothetical protein
VRALEAQLRERLLLCVCGAVALITVVCGATCSLVIMQLLPPPLCLTGVLLALQYTTKLPPAKRAKRGTSMLDAAPVSNGRNLAGKPGGTVLLHKTRAGGTCRRRCLIEHDADAD